MSESTNKTGVNNTKNKFPEWIQSKIFLDLLKQLHDDFVQIVDFNIDNALAPGENYVTIMLKVEIVMKLKDSSTKPISFMLKISPNSQVFEDFSKFHNVFTAEAGMYRNFVPEFEQLYAEAGAKVKFGAKSYDLPAEEDYILLEDLKVQGFKNTNRLDGLDMEHTKSVLKKLAQWHAASAVRVARKGPYPREYCTCFIKPEAHELMRNCFNASTETLLECIKEYTNSNLYYDHVVKLQHQLTDEILKYAEPDLSEFNVLNHGDCWSNNIMFKYDDKGNILETYLVDYQMPRYTSPALDLLYFLLSSTKLEIKLKEFEYFIKYYHDHLVESLKILSYNKTIPSLKDIHIMIYKYGIYGYMTTTNVMAAILCDPTDNATLDNFVNNAEFKRHMFSNSRYRAHMEALFPWMLYKGFLEC